ncbi:MAG: hypothetical protein KME03_10860 [Aphanocapsa lilacina HA4352-LM1]|jgi:hypothetical protein|nr:hypothetical protein [Aphanocapsa lilacina HA4352-LM1]
MPNNNDDKGSSDDTTGNLSHEENGHEPDPKPAGGTPTDDELGGETENPQNFSEEPLPEDVQGFQMPDWLDPADGDIFGMDNDTAMLVGGIATAGVLAISGAGALAAGGALATGLVLGLGDDLLFDQGNETVEASADGVEGAEGETEVGFVADTEDTFAQDDSFDENANFYSEDPEFYAAEEPQYGDTA